MKKVVWLTITLARLAWSDAGVLLPADKPQPDPAVLSLDEMSIDIRIDNGHARVRTQQIFGSHRGTVMEGNYLFVLPGQAIVSDFAIWEDLTRIPGVILERKRAEELYKSIRNQMMCRWVRPAFTCSTTTRGWSVRPKCRSKIATACCH